MDRIDLSNIDLIEPTRFVFNNNQNHDLMVDVYEDMIIVSTKYTSWELVNEIKKDFESTISPSNKRSTYIKRHIKHFLFRLSELF